MKVERWKGSVGLLQYVRGTETQEPSLLDLDQIEGHRLPLYPRDITALEEHAFRIHPTMSQCLADALSQTIPGQAEEEADMGEEGEGEGEEGICEAEKDDSEEEDDEQGEEGVHKVRCGVCHHWTQSTQPIGTRQAELSSCSSVQTMVLLY